MTQVTRRGLDGGTIVAYIGVSPGDLKELLKLYGDMPGVTVKRAPGTDTVTVCCREHGVRLE
jgi:hypothetical protein